MFSKRGCGAYISFAIDRPILRGTPQRVHGWTWFVWGVGRDDDGHDSNTTIVPKYDAIYVRRFLRISDMICCSVKTVDQSLTCIVLYKQNPLACDKSVLKAEVVLFSYSTIRFSTQIYLET